MQAYYDDRFVPYRVVEDRETVVRRSRKTIPPACRLYRPVQADRIERPETILIDVDLFSQYGARCLDDGVTPRPLYDWEGYPLCMVGRSVYRQWPMGIVNARPMTRVDLIYQIFEIIDACPQKTFILWTQFPNMLAAAGWLDEEDGSPRMRPNLLIGLDLRCDVDPALAELVAAASGRVGGILARMRWPVRIDLTHVAAVVLEPGLQTPVFGAGAVESIAKACDESGVAFWFTGWKWIPCKASAERWEGARRNSGFRGATCPHGLQHPPQHCRSNFGIGSPAENFEIYARDFRETRHGVQALRYRKPEESLRLVRAKASH